MGVDERLPRLRNVEERVAAGGDVTQAAADGDEEVGLLHPAGERGVEADRQVARVDGRVVVHVVLAAERGGDGQRTGLAEGEHVLPRLRAPATLADDDQRPLRAREELLQAREVAVRRLRARRGDGRRVGDVGLLEEHVLR